MKRRTFLQTTIGAGFVGSVAPNLLLGAAKDKPNEKLNIGIIGSGGRGSANMRGVASENIVALCDVNGQTLAASQKKHPKAKAYFDWRKLLEDKSIDAVTVSTADHCHALAAVAAMRAGKHVYCEKPLAHSVHEARVMRETFAKSKVATQMGTQIHATDNYRRVVELVQSGAIGPVREAHVWCSRTINPIGAPVLERQSPPDWFHWDEWQGPAPDRYHNQGYWKGGNLNWNRRWDYGNGVLGDMGSHLIDLPWWALELTTPLTCEAHGPKADAVACPPWMRVTWEHAARKGRAALEVPVKVVWYHGGRSKRDRPDIETGMDLGKWGNGILFVGDKGMLLADYGKRILLPKEKFGGHKAPKPWIAKSLGHHREWIHAAKTGAPTTCNFEYSGSLIEHNLLGSVAYRVGKKLQWDAKNLKATNAPEAAKYIRRDYRKGWSI
jgi:predicted dehydrogenase